MPKPRWTRGCDSGACVEVLVQKTQVKIRDSKNKGVELKFSLEEWEQFKNGVVHGAFD